MGLFDLFKKKPKHEDLVRAVYTFIENKDKKIINILFPGGIEELSKIIISLSLICKIELEKCPPEAYLKLSELYSMTMLQFELKGDDTKAIISFLKNKYPDWVFSDDIGMCLLVFYRLHSEKHTFFLTNESSVKEFEYNVHSQIEIDKIKESVMQEIERENEELKKIRQKKEHDRKQKNQEIIFGVIKKYPETYLREFSAVLDKPLDVSSICGLIHNENLFEKKHQEHDLSNGDTYDFEYFFDLLKSTLSIPSNDIPSPEEAAKLAEENEMTVEQYMAMRALENENAQLRYDRQIESFKKWSKQAEKLKQEYPKFDIQQEYKSENFRVILSNSDMKTAYEIVHFPELYDLKINKKSFEEKHDGIFCRKCGTSIPGDSVFCYKCGERVEK